MPRQSSHPEPAEIARNLQTVTQISEQPGLTFAGWEQSDLGEVDVSTLHIGTEQSDAQPVSDIHCSLTVCQ